MAENKKQHILGQTMRGQGSGQYSGQAVAATRPNFGYNPVYSGYSRSSGQHTQSGANGAQLRQGKS